MQVTVLYFAVFRERVGVASERVELAPGTNIGALISELERRHPPIAELKGAYRVALNKAFTNEAAPLTDGAEVALIPPVSGG